jgi:exodeoxyribonuclease VII small subunit
VEKKTPSAKIPSFEKSVARLDELVARLEKGDVPLDDALALFEEGSALVKTCHTLLDTAEQKVMQLTKNPDGTPAFVPFEEQG